MDRFECSLRKKGGFENVNWLAFICDWLSKPAFGVVYVT